MILWGRTEKCLKDTAAEISLSGTECHYFLCDVANREEVYKQAKVLREKVRSLRCGRNRSCDWIQSVDMPLGCES